MILFIHPFWCLLSYRGLFLIKLIKVNDCCKEEHNDRSQILKILLISSDKYGGMTMESPRICWVDCLGREGKTAWIGIYLCEWLNFFFFFSNLEYDNHFLPVLMQCWPRFLSDWYLTEYDNHTLLHECYSDSVWFLKHLSSNQGDLHWAAAFVKDSGMPT